MSKLNQSNYYDLEPPAVLEARSLALEVVNDDITNQMIVKEHQNFRLLDDEIQAQKRKREALNIIADNDAIKPSEKSLYANILVDVPQPPAPVIPRSIAPAPAPAPARAEEEEEEEEDEIEDEDDDLPETLKVYNQMDAEQIDIVAEAFYDDIDNMSDTQRRALLDKANQTISKYSDRLNSEVLDLMQDIVEYTKEVIQEGLEEKAAEPEPEPETPAPTNVKQYKAFFKTIKLKNVDQLRKNELIELYEKRNELPETLQAEIDAFIRARSQEKYIKTKMKPVKRMSGNGLKEDLNKILLLTGSQQAGNDSLKLQKEIVKIQKRLKKQFDKMNKSDAAKLLQEVNQQRIKALAKM